MAAISASVLSLACQWSYECAQLANEFALRVFPHLDCDFPTCVSEAIAMHDELWEAAVAWFNAVELPVTMFIVAAIPDNRGLRLNGREYSTAHDVAGGWVQDLVVLIGAIKKADADLYGQRRKTAHRRMLIEYFSEHSDYDSQSVQASVKWEYAQAMKLIGAQPAQAAGSSTEKAVGEPKPIRASVAAKRYHVTKRRLVELTREKDSTKRLSDLRPPGCASNAPMILDENEVAARFPVRT